MKLRLQRYFYLTLLLLPAACSVKKDNFTNRSYHQMTAWFNTLFNGQEAMDGKLEELKTTYQDDYFDILNVEPYPEFKANDEAVDITAPEKPEGNFFNKAASGNLTNNQNSQYSGFEKAEEKALKAIADHSMVIRNEERNKLIARSYLMLGQARYYQGKTFPALDALSYVTNNLDFEKHEAEAKYFMALAQIQAGNKYAAAEILQPLYDDEDLDKALKEDVAKQYAELFIDERDYISALNGLDVAIKNARSKEDEARYNYIQGQLLTSLKRYDEAHDKFMRVYKLKPGFEMETCSQVAIANNFDPKFDDYTAFKSQLEKLLKIGTYETYRNEFYYALGNMELKRDSVERAEDYYKKSLAEKVSDPRFRGETYAALGDLFFQKSDYVFAGAYYDSAVTAMPESERKLVITKFRDDLKSIINKYYLVKRNDSILRLAAMPQAEQETFFNNYIAELKLKDEAKLKAQAEESNTVFATETKNGGFNNSFGDNSGKFYFYSNSAKNFGESEFRRVWGDVQLKDNWRTSISGTTIEDQKAELLGTNNQNNPRRYELAYYIEQIPTKEADLHNLKMERDTTELSLGIDYFDRFKDRKLSTSTLVHLVETPPKDPNVELKAYYNLYRINKGENEVIANQYKDLVLNKYPNTVYAEYILNPDVEYFTQNTSEAIKLYDQAYAAYEEEDFQVVKNLSLQAMNDFPNDAILAKFSLLNAYADAVLTGVDEYKSSLERTVVLFEGTPEADYAQYLLDKLNGKVTTAQPPAKPQQNEKAEEEEAKRQKMIEEKEANRPEKPRRVPDMSEDEGGETYFNKNQK